MLVYLNNTQALFIIFVGNPLNTGGFAGSCIPVQQTGVRFSARYKSLGIFNQLLFGNLIAHKVFQVHMGNI